jgi:hypothetical protein
MNRQEKVLRGNKVIDKLKTKTSHYICSLMALLSIIFMGLRFLVYKI